MSDALVDQSTFGIVDPLMVREFVPTGLWDFFGGVFVMDTFTVTDVGLATERLDYDEDQVDCSNRMFQITNWMLMDDGAPALVWCFPSRRWRNLRVDQHIVGHPSAETPLLFIGNPIRVERTKDIGLVVIQAGNSFIIKSGVELGY